MASLFALGLYHRYSDLGPRAFVEGPAGRNERLTVALERQPGTPVAEVSREVGRLLDWPVYDHELVERLAADMGVPVSEVEAVDETAQGWLLDCLEGFSSTAGRELKYVHHLRLLLGSLAEQGNCVIVGRGAAQFLPPASTLRVWLVANPEDRAISSRSHVSSHEAARVAHEKWRRQASFVRKYHCKDPARPDNYDLVLNTSQWPAAHCARVIAAAALPKRG
jgi:cytidylate kinase